MIHKKLLSMLAILVLVIGFLCIGITQAVAEDSPYEMKTEYETNNGELNLANIIKEQEEKAAKAKQAAELKELKTNALQKIRKAKKKYIGYMTSKQKKSVKKSIQYIKNSKTKTKVRTHYKKTDKVFDSAKKCKKYVVKWAKRIDKYLKNSNMAGCGKYYALAAWKNSIDPRWAPAISCVESGKGAAYVSGTYNAWGWGGGYIVLGSCWESSIHNYVAQLKSGYGSSLTQRAANKYCEGGNWYSLCAAEISKI